VGRVVTWLRRLLSLEPAAVGSATAALYAASAMLYRAEVSHTAVLQPDLLVAAVMGLWGLWTRARVTPLAQPQDAAGRALKPSQQ
jgi:hypothetical protein